MAKRESPLRSSCSTQERVNRWSFSLPPFLEFLQQRFQTRQRRFSVTAPSTNITGRYVEPIHDAFEPLKANIFAGTTASFAEALFTQRVQFGAPQHIPRNETWLKRPYSNGIEPVTNRTPLTTHDGSCFPPNRIDTDKLPGHRRRGAERSRRFRVCTSMVCEPTFG